MRSGLFLLALPVLAQTVSFEDYRPKSTLVVPGNPVTRAKFPFVDIHGHPRGMLAPNKIDQLLKEMDELNMRVMVNLDGRSGDRLKQTVDAIRAKAPKRFVVFANLDYTDIDNPEWGKRAARALEQDVRNGATGLKIYKNLGMDLKDSRGKRIQVDDQRFDPVWAAAGRLKIPVLIHTADPAPFWDPHDKNNERWLELKEMPGRARAPEKYPPWKLIITEQHNVFRKHKDTNFINAHLGWYGNDLGELGRLMEEMPNMHTEIGAVLAELGRQPRTARRFFIRFQNRILFGKDSYNQSEYHTYFRVLETADEYFDYYRRRHAFWQMYGLDLPDIVLKKVYYGNAARLVPGIDPKWFLE
jgi:predicted TIM-barrel fold metal-dependent hydrolase